MKISLVFLALVFAALMLLAAIAPALAITPELGLPHSLHPGKNGSFMSTNWSGYAVTGSKGSVTSVSGSWIVPSVTGGVNNGFVNGSASGYKAGYSVDGLKETELVTQMEKLLHTTP